MKVILYMGISVNGYIAKTSEDTSWITDVEWENYKEMCNKTGNVIMGRRTYEIAKDEGYFPFTPESFQVIVTSQKFKNDWPNQVAFVKSPKEAIRILEEKGFKKALVGGGGDLDSAFMDENLIDEIYLDIEPIVLGNGIKLFADADFESKLELIGTKNLSKNEIQLHYKVLK